MIRDPILSRARGEYLEMPGMSLTVEQACAVLETTVTMLVSHPTGKA